MAKGKKKFYVVWQGHETGVFLSWAACQKAVKGVKNAKFKSFQTKKEAEKAFRDGHTQHIKPKNIKNKNTATRLLSNFKAIDLDSISVDAASSGNPGKMEYRGVHTKTGKQIFRKGIYHYATNNIGEFLALVHACALLKQKNLNQKTIYTDSRTAMSWLRKGKCNTKLKPNQKNADVFKLVARAEEWLAKNKIEANILKWQTKKWGEIPADFGRK